MLDTSVLIERAQLLLEQGRSKDAALVIKSILEQEPENAEALSILARCYYDEHATQQGIEAMQRAIALEPYNSYFFYLLAFGYYQARNSKDAHENIVRAVQMNPYFAEYFGLYSYILIAEKEFEKSLEKANEGLAIEADNVTCLNARSRALNNLRRLDDAIETMEYALAKDPNNEMTHTNMGWNLLEKGRHKEATHHFLEALRINPNQESSKSGLKEALKSKIAPYRWLLQYSFWIQHKGKRFQMALPIVLYIAFRVLFAAFEYTHPYAGWFFAGLYLLVVVTSWSINSIANFVLLFNPIGKYALTNTERWGAIAVVSALFTGIALVCTALFTNLLEGTVYNNSLVFAGLLCMSLVLPLGSIPFPVQIAGSTYRQKVSLGLIATGLVTLAVFAVAPAFIVLFVIYGLAFLAYNWSSALR